MAATEDFRQIQQFTIDRVDRSGKYVGRITYWRLYATENLYRILIYSILSAQLGHEWWIFASSPKMQRDVISLRLRYKNSPWACSPGQHEIYYLNLSELNVIVNKNIGKFRPVVPNIDDLVLRIEMIRLPRNVVAHMNFPNRTDKHNIKVVHEYMKGLILAVQANQILQIVVPT